MLPPKQNYTKLYNQFLDEFVGLMTPQEVIVFLCILRHTHGFNRPTARLSVSVLQNGFTDNTGNEYIGTNFSRATVVKALDGLIKYGFITKITTNRKGTVYSINADVKVEELKERHQAKKAKDTKKMKRIVSNANYADEKNNTALGRLAVPDEIFNWLAVNIYNLNVDTITKAPAGRIAKTKSALQAIHEELGTELTVEDLKKFKDWWKRGEYSRLTMPRDAEKLTEYYLEFYGRHKASSPSKENQRINLSMRAQSMLGYEYITKGLFNDEIEEKMKEIEANMKENENY
jgi:hypothetical protein